MKLSSETIAMLEEAKDEYDAMPPDGRLELMKRAMSLRAEDYNSIQLPKELLAMAKFGMLCLVSGIDPRKVDSRGEQ